MAKAITIGDRFGRLTILRPAGKRLHFVVRCECGTEKTVYASDLRSGKVVSCGCFRLEQISSHGAARTRTYRIWQGMRNRCLNPNETGYHRYGGRGITVCARWRDSFENFLADMGHAPVGMQIERMDNDGHYEPDNCKWATRKEQNVNRRDNVLLTIGDETKCIAEWCAVHGVAPGLAYKRINRSGWDPVKAVTTPALSRRERSNHKYREGKGRR